MVYYSPRIKTRQFRNENPFNLQLVKNFNNCQVSLPSFVRLAKGEKLAIEPFAHALENGDCFLLNARGRNANKLIKKQ